MRRTDREMPDWAWSWRSARTWEWLLMLLLLALAGGVRAGPIYKCIDADGGIAYQGIACSPAQREATIELAPAPAYAKSPEYAVEREPASARRAAPASRHGTAAEAASYECRSADGQVFYRHSMCPHSIAAVDGRPALRGARRSGGSGTVSVSAQRISRDEACREIHAAGAIGRAGHQHDDDVSTYERNLGRDPCH